MADNDVNAQLHVAIQDRAADKVRDLIRHQGADPNATTNNNASPIYCATLMGDLEVVRILAEFGVDPNIARTDDGTTPIFMAAWNGHLEIVRILGKLGADPNLATTDEGVTPIFMAAWNGHVQVVRALGQLGADPNKKQ
jgi:ankyrin repeat protein